MNDRAFPSRAATSPPAQPVMLPVGDDGVRLWGLAPRERLARLAKIVGLPIAATGAAPMPALLADTGHVVDAAWLRHLAERPGTALTLAGRPVLAHAVDEAQAATAAQAMRAGLPLPANDGFALIAAEDAPELTNKLLRKRERPLVMPLRADTVPELERRTYQASYKGVTDLLTKYLWPQWAFVLTRVAARLGISPNMVTLVGVALCIAATFAFADGRYWLGMALGLTFMVLDTVDGKLARCTFTSSPLGDMLDHGVDLVHPPFWWWAWGVGLAAHGLALPNALFATVMAVIVGGYVLQRLIEGIFIRRFDMHIHVWRKADSNFRLVTARRNPNMVILFVATLAGRPDIGLVAVAIWTLLSLLFHAVRLAAAFGESRRGRPIVSWLDAEA